MATETRILTAPLDGTSVRLYAEVTGMLARFNSAITPKDDVANDLPELSPDTAETEAALRLALVAMTEAQRRIERQEARIRELESLSVTDELTGLLNRRGFDMHLVKALAQARRGERRGVLLMIDLDRFKPINDTYGHAAGDEVLKTASIILQGQIRETDYVGRLGGDEFAILLPRSNKRNGMRRAQELDKKLNNAYASWNGIQIPIKASCGIHMYTSRAQLDELLASADKEMYKIKMVRKEKQGISVR